MQSLHHPLLLENLTIPGNIMAAPMAGYSDSVSRFLACEGGADLCWTEMISAEALCRNSRRTRDMMEPAANEQIPAVQLFGSDPEVLGRAADIASRGGAAILDLNAGCPVGKVVSKGAGAALARDPVQLSKAISAMRRAGLPVCVKIRSGWDETEQTWKAAALRAEEAGAAAIGFHPRNRSQGYGGLADWSLIEKLVDLVEIPVFGSGDLDSPEAAVSMLDQTGCAGVMFARGALGDPGIYSRTRALLEHSDAVGMPSRQERLEAALRHLNLAAARFGEEKAGREMKKHLVAYVKGWESAAELRTALVRARDLDEQIRLLGNALKEILPGTS